VVTVLHDEPVAGAVRLARQAATRGVSPAA
jgi:hypothetical protein